MSRRKVFVAGGTGLVGSNLVLKLHEAGLPVRASFLTHRPSFLPKLFRRHDFTDFKQCLAAVKGMDTVFICAAKTYGIQMSQNNPASMVLPNLAINAGLFEACRAQGVEKVIFISTSIVYQSASRPVAEDDLDLNKPVFPLYQGPGWVKRYVEQLGRFYHDRFGLKVGIVRPTNIYGPHDKFDDAHSHVIPALIKRALKKETPFKVWGSPRVVKDFLYVDDFIDDLLKVEARFCGAEPLNVAGGDHRTIEETAQVILDACGHRVKPVFDKKAPSSVPLRLLNTKKYERLFGQPKRTPFEEGIRRTVAWYREAARGRR